MDMNVLESSIERANMINESAHISALNSMERMECDLLTWAAYPTLRNPVPPSRTVSSQRWLLLLMLDSIYLSAPLPFSRESIVIAEHYARGH